MSYCKPFYKNSGTYGFHAHKKLLSAPYFALFIAYTQKIANWFVYLQVFLEKAKWCVNKSDLK